MKQGARKQDPVATPAKQLARFIAMYDAKIGALARSARSKLRKQMPTAAELVYDNYNALAIGFGPTERASEIIVSLALYPRWVSLFFTAGAELSDPEGLLRGSGKKIRHIVLEDAAALDDPAVRALLVEAILHAQTPLPSKGRGRTVIKSVSTRQRPRRRTPKARAPKKRRR